MQRRLVFLINPRSGVQKGPSLQDLIEEKCTAAGLPFEIAATAADGDYNWLCEKIKAEQVTDVIVCGGDGTISAVVAGIRNSEVQVGIVPRGSGNGLALAAGISTNPEKALDKIINGYASPVDAFLVNGQFSCMLSGLGFDAQVAHDFDRQQKRGFWKYAQLTFEHFLKIKTYPFYLEADECKQAVDAYFISMANSNQFGNGFTIAPKASLQDGKIDVVVVEKANKFVFLLKVLWHIRFGTFTTDFQKRFGILYFQTKRLRIENKSLAPFHIDGDGKPTAEVFEVEVLPAAYRLIQ